MKKLAYIGIALASSLVIAQSCSQSLLDIPKKGVISIENFYQTEEDALSAVTTVYAAAIKAINIGPGFGANWCIAPSFFVLKNAPADDMYYGSGNAGDHVFGIEINEYRPTFGSNSDVVANNYRGMYQVIYACNLLLDHYQFGTNSNIDRYLAEAMTIRAWMHLHLTTYWGDVPYVDHVLLGSDRPGQTPRAEVLSKVITDLETAAKYLPSRKGQGDKEGAVRLTKEAALAFLGKAQLFSGDYAAAKTTLKQVITSGNYDLVPSEEMMYIHHGRGDGSCEKVFELNYIDNTDAIKGFGGHMHVQRNQSCFWRDLKGLPDLTIQLMGWGGGGNPSQKFVDAIIANEGDSYRRKAWIISYEELLCLNYSTLGDTDATTDEEKLMDGRRGITPEANGSGGYYANCGWFTLKYAPFMEDKIVNNDCATDNNHVIMRYAEVLLMYAEACAQTNDNDGLQYLQAIQRRAGAPVSSSLTLDAVKKEKFLEMFMEGCRYEDLVRWGDAVQELGDNGKEVPSFQDDYLLSGGTRPHKAIINLENAHYNGSNCGFKANKNELMPFPFGELNMNDNIHQNKGWE